MGTTDPANVRQQPERRRLFVPWHVADAAHRPRSTLLICLILAASASMMRVGFRRIVRTRHGAALHY